MKTGLFFGTAFCGGALLAAAVQADEIWETNFGQVVYQDDIGRDAVWRYPAGIAYPGGIIVIEGLAGNYSKRGTHKGYWMADGVGEVACVEPITDPYGSEHSYWGHFEITFRDQSFPTDWDAVYGYCGIVPDNNWSGRVRDF